MSKNKHSKISILEQNDQFAQYDNQSQNSISASISESQQFSSRFQGKQDYMTKDGYYGIVKNTKNPIQKYQGISATKQPTKRENQQVLNFNNPTDAIIGSQTSTNQQNQESHVQNMRYNQFSSQSEYGIHNGVPMDQSPQKIQINYPDINGEYNNNSNPNNEYVTGKFGSSPVKSAIKSKHSSLVLNNANHKKKGSHHKVNSQSSLNSQIIQQHPNTSENTQSNIFQTPMKKPDTDQQLILGKSGQKVSGQKYKDAFSTQIDGSGQKPILNVYTQESQSKSQVNSRSTNKRKDSLNVINHNQSEGSMQTYHGFQNQIQQVSNYDNVYSEPPELVTNRIDQIQQSPNIKKRGLNSLSNQNQGKVEAQAILAQNRMANIKRPGGVETDPSKEKSNLDIRVNRNHRRQISNSSNNDLGFVIQTPNFNQNQQSRGQNIPISASYDGSAMEGQNIHSSKSEILRHSQNSRSTGILLPMVHRNSIASLNNINSLPTIESQVSQENGGESMRNIQNGPMASMSSLNHRQADMKSKSSFYQRFMRNSRVAKTGNNFDHRESLGGNPLDAGIENDPYAHDRSLYTNSFDRGGASFVRSSNSSIRKQITSQTHIIREHNMTQIGNEYKNRMKKPLPLQEPNSAQLNHKGLSASRSLVDVSNVTLAKQHQYQSINPYGNDSTISTSTIKQTIQQKPLKNKKDSLNFNNNQDPRILNNAVQKMRNLEYGAYDRSPKVNQNSAYRSSFTSKPSLKQDKNSLDTFESKNLPSIDGQQKKQPTFKMGNIISNSSVHIKQSKKGSQQQNNNQFKNKNNYFNHNGPNNNTIETTGQFGKPRLSIAQQDSPKMKQNIHNIQQIRKSDQKQKTANQLWGQSEIDQDINNKQIDNIGRNLIYKQKSQEKQHLSSSQIVGVQQEGQKALQIHKNLRVQAKSNNRNTPNQTSNVSAVRGSERIRQRNTDIQTSKMTQNQKFVSDRSEVKFQPKSREKITQNFYNQNVIIMQGTTPDMNQPGQGLFPMPNNQQQNENQMDQIQKQVQFDGGLQPPRREIYQKLQSQLYQNSNNPNQSSLNQKQFQPSSQMTNPRQQRNKVKFAIGEKPSTQMQYLDSKPKNNTPGHDLSFGN